VFLATGKGELVRDSEDGACAGVGVGAGEASNAILILIDIDIDIVFLSYAYTRIYPPAYKNTPFSPLPNLLHLPLLMPLPEYPTPNSNDITPRLEGNFEIGGHTHGEE